jgi:hypothetical protein
MEKISWTDRVRSEEVLQRVKDKRNILQIIKRRKGNRFGYILRRNCFMKHVIEGKAKGMMEMTRIREIRCKKLLYDRKGQRGYWNSG